MTCYLYKKRDVGRLGAQLVERLPSAQVVIVGSWDQVPCRSPCSMGIPLLPLLAASPACARALSLSLTNK